MMILKYFYYIVVLYRMSNNRMSNNMGLKIGFFLFLFTTIILGILYFVKLSENCTDCESEEENDENCAESEPPKVHADDYTSVVKKELTDQHIEDIQQVSGLVEPTDETLSFLCSSLTDCGGYSTKSDGDVFFHKILTDEINTDNLDDNENYSYKINKMYLPSLEEPTEQNLEVPSSIEDDIISEIDSTTI